MTLSLEDALSAAIQWLQNIRSLAEDDAAYLGLVLLDTQPENITLLGLLKTLNDPGRLTDGEKDLIRQGKIIPAAVKAVHARTGLGLKESLAVVKAWADTERAAGRLPPAIPRAVAPNTPKMLEPTPAMGTRVTEDLITAEDIASFAKSGTDETSFPLVKRTIGPNDDTPSVGTDIGDLPDVSPGDDVGQTILPVYGGES